MTLTYAKMLNRTLDDLLANDLSVYLLGEDICDPYGGAFKVTKGLSTKYPKRLFNTPISEAALTGIVTGMALRGLRPILEIMFGDFLTLCTDQIVSNIAKFSWMYNKKISLPLVIRTPMGGRRGYGPTHSQAIEKIFLGIPGLKMIAPTCYHEVGKLLKTSVEDPDPILFIEYKADYVRPLLKTKNGMIDEYFVKVIGASYPTILLSPTNFTEDMLTVITYGGMAYFVLEAMKYLLYEEEITAQIIIPSLIKPFNFFEVTELIQKTGRVVIVEEGGRSYGWGSELAASIYEECFVDLKTPIIRVGALDLPIANTKPLEDYILPNKQDIICAVKEVL